MRVVLLTAVLLECLPYLTGAQTSPVRGLDPALWHRYNVTSSGLFRCLDGSLTVPLSAINDDYCDCPDGSDEPGTSACEGVGGGWFWCTNKGHIPGKVRRSRVNDGLCEAECCDGSDEWETQACPDRCEAIGKVYREEKEAELKARKTGSKIRSTYVKFAVSERKRLQEEIDKKTAEVQLKEAEAEAARRNLDRVEASSREALERRKQSPLYIHSLAQKLALVRLRSKTSRLESELKELKDILEELSKSYNPNYQDMAVKAAVVGYEELRDGPQSEEGEEGKEEKPTAEGEEEIEDRELDDVERKDLESLLLSDDDDLEYDDEGGLLYKLDEYIPDALYDSWEAIRDLTIDWMIRLGILGKGSKASPTSVEGPHVAAARKKHQDLSNEVGGLHSDINNARTTLDKMHLAFGPDSEWKKLDGTCVDKVAGDYTYELCFFGKATQKSNKDSSSNNLGTFSGWKDGATEGTFDYYTTQRYTNGAKCWNGPMRSATVSLSCGTQNALLSISEPEKCEYQFTVTSPALCWPLDKEDASASNDTPPIEVKEEL